MQIWRAEYFTYNLLIDPGRTYYQKLKQDIGNWCAALFPRLLKAAFVILESTHWIPNEAQLWLWGHSLM